MQINKLSASLKPQLLAVFIVTSLAFSGCVASEVSTTKEADNNPILLMIDGGKLYDAWWLEDKGAGEPKTDNSLWKLQTTNHRKGSDTWRCKECHGWDYKGKDGAYGAGSHKTGFPGILGSNYMSVEELEAILKGSTNPDHDFSSVISDDAIHKIAVFIRTGLIDLKYYIDYSTKKPLQATIENGREVYVRTKCSHCHGENGDLAAPSKDEFLGTIANDNPWEFIHKSRFGSAGVVMPALKIKLPVDEKRDKMPSGVKSGYDMQDMLDLLEFCRSLPHK
jgi:thiosulfate dehydrogenase